jgi:hypothetical protein
MHDDAQPDSRDIDRADSDRHASNAHDAFGQLTRIDACQIRLGAGLIPQQSDGVVNLVEVDPFPRRARHMDDTAIGEAMFQADVVNVELRRQCHASISFLWGAIPAAHDAQRRFLRRFGAVRMCVDAVLMKNDFINTAFSITFQ